jgi:hypothetical protein
MKKLILSIALMSIPFVSTAAPSVNNNSSSFSTPNFNWGNGNNNNGSNWNMPSMPNMNWGNNNSNGYGNNWSMPSFNSGNGNGNSWNMPNMNWGTNRSFGNGFGNNQGNNWNMPSMNGGNNGNNWNMPNFNWNNNSKPSWNSGNWGNNVPNYSYMPRAPQQNLQAQAKTQNRIPTMPAPPQFIPRLDKAREMAAKPATAKLTKPSTQNSIPSTTQTMMNKVPMPKEVKGVILAPDNKVEVPVASKAGDVKFPKAEEVK